MTRPDHLVPAREPVEDLLRQLAPQVLGALVRRFGHFGDAEDAVQEALLAAAAQWSDRGVPEHPRGWLITVAYRRMTDQLRRDQARKRREDTVVARTPTDRFTAPAADDEAATDRDDTLALFFLCCHPVLSPASRIALTLRAVGGLSTAEIASAFLVPDATMAQRISRAKQRIKERGLPLAIPDPTDRAERLEAVLHVLYLIFNEGYTATSGTALRRDDLAAEALRLARMLHRLLPQDAEVTGLLALMVLTEARRAARCGPAGELIPLADQDRARWDTAAIVEGGDLVAGALARGPIGPYQLQAAIAAVHADARRAEDTDWRQILALYDVLERITENPVVTLNHAVAEAMVHGPNAGLARLRLLDDDGRMADHHRLAAVRAHLLEMAGDTDAAVTHYRAAARQTKSVPEQRYLELRAGRLERA